MHATQNLGYSAYTKLVIFMSKGVRYSKHSNNFPHPLSFLPVEDFTEIVIKNHF